MAAPNIKSPTSITGFTTSVGIGTTAIVGILTNTAASNQAYKINSIFAANVDGTTTVNVSVSILRNGSDRYLMKNVSVPVGATQVVSTKDTYFYLEENVGIRAQANSANGIDITISGEVIS